MKSIYFFGVKNPFNQLSGREEWQSALKLKGSFYQKSIFSFIDDGLSFPKEKINSGDEWWNKQIYDDLSKTYVKRILEEPADFILVDAFGCIAQLCEVCNGEKKTRVSCVQYMTNVLQSLESEGIVTVGERFSLTKMSEPDIRMGVKLFCEKLLSVYKSEQIIIHKAGYPEFYICDGEIGRISPIQLEKNKGNIAALNIIYSAFEDYLSGAHFIDMPSTVYSLSNKWPFNYCQEYINYVITSVMMYIEPDIAQKMLSTNCTTMFMYRMVQSNMLMSASPEKQKALNVQAIIDDYEFKLESYNRKFREYEDKFLELYNFIMDTNYESMPWPEDELSFSEFINLKQNYPIEYRKNDYK